MVKKSIIKNLFFLSFICFSFFIGGKAFEGTAERYQQVLRKLVEKINKQGVNAIAAQINNGQLDYQGHYFFIIEEEKPYRIIAHGGNIAFAGRTPEEGQKIVFPRCKEDYCNVAKLVSDLAAVAKKGGGFHTYQWKVKEEDPLRLKLSYVEPFVYQGKNYFVGIGTQERQEFGLLAGKRTDVKSKKIIIVNVDGIYLFPADLERIKTLQKEEALPAYEFITYDDVPRNDQETIARAKDANIVIASFNITKNVIDHCPYLEAICVGTTGADHVDLAAANKRGIKVFTVDGYATEAVAEHNMGLMIESARFGFQSYEDFRKGIYTPKKYLGKQLKGKTLGIIGLGRIGSAVARMSQSFGMRIISTNSKSTQKDFENLLKQSDVISVNCTLTKETENLLGDREFKLMKPSIVLVNTARGAIINEKALIKNLTSGKIFAFGADVLEEEPMTSHPKLFSFPQVIVTPHIGFNTEAARINRSKMMADNVAYALLDVLPKRVEKVAQILEKEGLIKASDEIDNKMKDDEKNIFLFEINPPYRMVAHGGNKGFIGKTPEEFQQLNFPGCTQENCNMRKLVENVAAVAKRGGGFYTYHWRLQPKESVKLKIAYVKPVTYHGKTYVIGAGYYI